MKKYRTYIAFAVTALVMILFFPSTGRFNYHYQKGHPWVYEDLVARIDFPILKTSEEILSEMEKRSSEIVSCYNYDEDVRKAQIAALNRSEDIPEAILKQAIDLISSTYEVGVAAESSDRLGSDRVIMVKRGKRMSEVPAQEVYSLEAARIRLLSELRYAFPKSDIDEMESRFSLTGYIVPNLILDESMTQLMHEEAIKHISPTKGMIYDGQLIVTKGELVTEDVAQLLDSYKAEYESNFRGGGEIITLLSHILLVIVMMLMLYIAVYCAGSGILEDFRKLLFVLFMALAVFLLTVFLGEFNRHFLLAFPFPVLALYIGAFFRRNVTVPLYWIILLPMLVMSGEGLQLYLINAVSGALVLGSHARFNRGFSQFINALVVFASAAIIYFAFHVLYSGDAWVWNRFAVLAMAVNGIFTVIAYPFVFLIERIFGFTSQTRMWELTDTNSTVLRELARRAPGTFQHCLQVANLAEDAAREVGADPMTIRAGALYHDIGKMANPLCFVENQARGAADTYHAGLTPQQSAHDIIAHVDDGLAFARKFGLPAEISAFINSHHGTSLTRYFYAQYCNAGGDPEDKAAFSYHGVLPHTKEEAILMIADSVEAASRTLPDYDGQSISALVDKIVESKVSDGQLQESDLSIRDISLVKESLKRSLMQIYHNRIAYPRAEAKQEAGAK